VSDHIHSVIVSYNRPELTDQAIRSYWASVRLPHSLVVVDNGSHQDTVKMLRRMAKMHGFQFLELGENRYPGYATNFGWALMPEETTLLHRADNDFVFLHGWDQHVAEMFAANPALGQLGLRTDAEELFNANNVGGNNVIRRQLWDEGLRYDERSWPDIARKVPGYTEDSFFTPAVKKLGWDWGRVTRPCIVDMAGNIGDGRYDEYLLQTRKDRKLT